MLTQLLHNPRCSKSRAALDLLQAQKIQPTIWLYLQRPPTVTEIGEILRKLDLADARQLMRQQEPLFATLGLASQVLSQQQLMVILSQNPILLERPIFIYGEKAIIGRPPERILTILP
jgi:arsenate reductase (glutaredoxin)